MRFFFFIAACLGLSRATLAAAGDEAIAGIDFGFNRILHGWTNYSTSFSATHDASPAGEFATVASFFTPAIAVQPQRYGVIVVWFGTGGQRLDFDNFTYTVSFWSGLDAFVINPRAGDLGTFPFSAPSGGSTTIADATTLGGRPAYYLQFQLPTSLPSLVLTQCHEYLVGFAAVAATGQSGELLVTTAPFDGPSDVQAGNIVPFGWTYLVNAGGQTIYSGQLAAELSVTPSGGRPDLTIRREGSLILLEWPEAFRCYTLESNEDAGASSGWTPVEEIAVPVGAWIRVTIETLEHSRWFRLRQKAEATP